MRPHLRKARLGLHLALIRLLWRAGWPKAVHYVGSSEVLPPPLTREEEIHLLDRLEAGDNGVKGILIERNLRLVVYIARKFENTGVHIEDLVSIGTIGLIKAVNTFDPAKKIKLATYASRCIENEILMYLRRNNKTKAEVSFDEPLNTDWDGNELLLSDVLGVESDVIKHIEEEVERALLQGGPGAAFRAGKTHHGTPLRLSRRPGKDAKRSGRRDGNFPVVHFAPGKENPQEAQARDPQDAIKSRRSLRAPAQKGGNL